MVLSCKHLFVVSLFHTGRWNGESVKRGIRNSGIAEKKTHTHIGGAVRHRINPSYTISATATCNVRTSQIDDGYVY